MSGYEEERDRDRRSASSQADGLRNANSGGAGSSAGPGSGGGHERDPDHNEHGRGHDHDHSEDGHSHAEHVHHDGDAHGHSHSHGHTGHSHDHAGHSHAGHSHSHGHAGHSHAGHGHHHHFGAAAGNRKGLALALTITVGIMALEFVGGLVTDSLALLSDSGHMLGDAAALLLSLLALGFAAKPASPQRTFGFHRMEILAALFNGVALFFIAGIIVWEAAGRLSDPPEVPGAAMMAIAAVGLLANLFSALSLTRHGDVKHNVNLRSAYLHVIGDAVGSIGAVAAGAVVWAFGWTWADPVISVVVALLILKSAWGIIRDTVHVLMEGAPAAVDCEQMKSALLQLGGVVEVHDLHVWTITSGLDAMSCHLRVDAPVDCQHVLQEALLTMERRFGIGHATIQIEKPELRHGDMIV